MNPLGSGMTLKLLAIDDEPQTLSLVEAALAQEGLEIVRVADAEAGLELFQRMRPQIVLLDLVMPKLTGMELLERMVAEDPGVDVILMTAHYSTDSAVEAIQKGACDYLTKPLDLAKLRARIANLVHDAQTRSRTAQLDNELVGVYQFEGIIGRSPLMLEVFSKVRRVAPHFRTVLVSGATGTGKELVASALHKRSPSGSRRFAVCNCAAVVETLFESELFGSMRGAFTGATQDRAGLFEYAEGGTVFLDEVSEMPLAAQAKLLRVLQHQEVQRVGAPAVRKVDVRVIAASNRALGDLVTQGKFRDDLYHRLSMVEICLPRLADRQDDLPLLQRYFVAKFAAQYGKTIKGITRRAQVLLLRYPWPGNVRELENVLGCACMMVDGEMIDVRDLPERLQRPESDPLADGALISLKELQRRHLLRVLEHVGGNKVRAAQILGISRTSVYQMLADIRKENEPVGGNSVSKGATNSSQTLAPSASRR